MFKNEMKKPTYSQAQTNKYKFKMCLQESAMSEKKLTAKKRPRRQEDEFDHFASFTKPKKRVCLDEIGKSL